VAKPVLRAEDLPRAAKSSAAQSPQRTEDVEKAMARRAIAEKDVAEMRLKEERRLTALRFLRCGQARSPTPRCTNLVVKLMCKYHDSAEIQSSGALALAAIAAPSPDHRPQVAGAGGIEAVTAALRNHASDAEVLRACCRALIILTGVSPEYRACATAAGAERAISEAVEGSPVFANDPDLASIVCYTLRCLEAREQTPEAVVTPPSSPLSLCVPGQDL